MADLISYGVFRFYEKGDDRFMPILFSRFDKEGQQIHGLVHWQYRSAPTVAATIITESQPSVSATVVQVTTNLPADKSQS
jgi:hypothetical protein